MEHVGRKIRKIREMKGYSQQYMASRLNMSQNNYSRIELEQNKINLQRLHEIAVVLEVDDFDILKFDDSLFFKSSFSHNQALGTNVEYSIMIDHMVKSLQDEIAYLRNENQRLLFLIEKTINRASGADQ